MTWSELRTRDKWVGCILTSFLLDLFVPSTFLITSLVILPASAVIWWATDESDNSTNDGDNHGSAH